jgi:predicted nucleic acid-binding protein
MIVADTSVLVPFFIPGDRTEQVQKVMRKDSDWIAPRLWRSEFRNVLATQMRISGLALKMAMQAMTEAEDLLREREFEPSSETVLYLANRSGSTAYDCEFVALAQLFEIPLLTEDQKLISAFPEMALTVASWLAS